jgi:redox-sensitive bicupin YhaK (pirin superfamily)
MGDVRQSAFSYNCFRQNEEANQVKNMIKIRKSDERGFFNHGWLQTYHTFSFADYYDPRYVGFSDLRVINEDFIAPAQGFPPHFHRDMEIITYVLSGELRHRDSLGNGSTTLPQEVQKMTAGRGVRHSEFSSETEKTHLLQIWIFPNEKNLPPSYEQIRIPDSEKRGKLRVIATNEKLSDAVHLNQDAAIYASILNNDEQLEYTPKDNRSLWLQLISGKLEINGQILDSGDGAAITEEKKLSVKALADNTHFLLFDLR